MRQQRGAALLLAMLTVAMVATLASAALWRQWRNIEIQGLEHNRSQASWVLDGALDWARLILREDARNGGPDHLAEPWAVVLREARLSSFLGADGDTTDPAEQRFLSGRITDAQARMNITNLVADGKVSEPDLEAFSRLFTALGLDPEELNQAAEQLKLAVTGLVNPDKPRPVPLLPRRLEHLHWIGLSSTSVAALAPHIVVLPVRTPLNLNTASAEAIAASLPGADIADARRLIASRERNPFRNLAEVQKLLDAQAPALSASQFSVASRFFEVLGQLRLEEVITQERSLLQRNGLDVVTVWRERGVPGGLTGAQR